MKIIIVMLIYFIVVAMDIIPLVKRKEKGQLILYSTITASALIVSIMLINGIKFISIASLINRILGLTP